MTTIKAAHYNETEERLTKDPIVISMAEALSYNELVGSFLHSSGEPTFDFMTRANDTYRERGGKDGGHIGAISQAIIKLITP